MSKLACATSIYQFDSLSLVHAAQLKMSYTDRFRTDRLDDGFGSSASSSPTSSSSTKATAQRLITMIQRACNATLIEPNLGLNLEIADMINSKKGSFPREAAVEIVRLINNRSPQVSILALSVLDICVKNCGYPFHLQISRKEFLNELVRKFPEKPTINYSRVQTLILEVIEEWTQTICKTSRYKEDLGYIRDMHRLLEYKGYLFPEVNRDDAAVLNPSDSLRSAQELEQEERDAQSAKLQELIRRGTPQDLKEANYLMSIMAGFRSDSKTDYRAKAAKDLDKLRRKADILQEMLVNLKPGDSISNDDVFSEIIVALKNAQPKITKMIDEEGQDDQDAMARLISLNDYIVALIEKYKLIKKGDHDGAARVRVTAPSGQSLKPNISNKQSLIDTLIDIDEGSPPGDNGSTNHDSSSNLIDTLGDLSFSNSTYGQGGNITLGMSTSPSITTTNTGSSSALVDLLGSNISTPSPPPPLPAPPPSQPAAEEWTFASAAPVSTTTTSKTMTILDTTLRIKFEITLVSSDNITIEAHYSNKSPIQQITSLNFQLAVPKSFTLKMDPQSGSTIGPNVSNGVSQQMHITTHNSNSSGLKLRWKVSYNVGQTSINEDGMITNII